MIREEAKKGKIAFQKNRLKQAEQHFTTALDLLADIERESEGMLNASYLDLKARLLSSRGRVRRDASHYSGAIEDFSSSLKQIAQHSEFATNVRNDLFYVLLLVAANRLGVSIDCPEKLR